MKKISVLVVLLALFLTGCVIIMLPTVQPLTEKVIGGEGADKILVVEVSGLLTDDDGERTLGIETAANLTARIREELELASEDDKVRAVVLRINSPGGSVTTCDIINHEIREFKKKRGVPIVAQLMDVAASGAYYVAVASDRIIAHPTTVTGSIGVIAYSVNAAGLMEKIGLSDQTIKSGDKKDIGSPLREMTDEEREILTSIVDTLHGRFLDVIAEGRIGLARKDLEEIADGRIYTAEQALALKLIDGTGYLDDSIELAKELAGVEKATIITYAQPDAYKNNVYSALQGMRAPEINLVNIDTGPLSMGMGVHFMYLWMP